MAARIVAGGTGRPTRRPVDEGVDREVTMVMEHDGAGDVAPAGREHLTRRQALGYGGAAAATVAAASVLAAAPAAAAGHTESVPMRSVSLAQANRIISAGIRYVRANPDLPPMFIVVVDAAGDEKASKRMDGNGPAAVALVPAKATTALAFRTSTAQLAARTTDPARIASFVAAGFSLLGGGRPIVEDGQVIGAIGVGGGTPEADDKVAEVALAALVDS